ncbi:MAG: Ig-like domain-containing protein [Blautia sp.]|nr:Ig-like domain-containing protein [Blautia sp.]MCM1199622.1 Ig-like domain-containing protein [Bacteroides fragilis]
MKKNQKRKVHDNAPVRKSRSISDDTLEFLSLDEETVAAYERKTRPARSEKSVPRRDFGKSVRKQEIYEDFDDETEEPGDIGEVNYDEAEYDVDGRYYGEEDEDNGRYDEEDGCRYEEDNEDDGRYYEEGGDDDRYYGEEDEDGGCYDEEDDDDRYYEEDDDGYYEIEDDEYYEMDDDEEDDEDDGKIFARTGRFITSMSAVDYIVAALGIFILMAAAVAGAVYINARAVSGQVEAFAEVGTEIQDISVIGESGLIAVADAESTRISQMTGLEPEMDEEGQSGEKPQGDRIEVGINLTSIQSDIKIKFVNKETNKLIGSVPFEVEITGGGRTFGLKDDDKDGIIYQTGLSAGTYMVKVTALPGEGYEKYHIPAQEETVKVADTISYKKVEVADEIKTEAEVNAAAEDTAQQNTVVESELKDTVEWVESTRNEENADDNYEEIKRENVPDPVTLARAGTFMKLVNSSLAGDNVRSVVSPEQPSIPPMDTDTAAAPSTGTDSTITPSTSEDTTNTPATSAGSTDTPPADTDPAGTDPASTPTTGTGPADTPTTSAGTTETPSTSVGATGTPSTGSGIVSPEQPAVPTQPAAPAVPTDAEKLSALHPVLNTTSLALTQGGSAELSIVVTGSEPYTVDWSSNSAAASVNNGVVTGAAAGTAVITATVMVGQESAALSCTVTVTEAAVQYTAVKIEGSAVIQMGGTASLKGTTTPEGGIVTWTSDNTDIVKIDNNGVMTGVSEGTAVITGICGDAKAAWQVKVTPNYTGDTVTKLKDRDGNQIYIRNSEGKYVEAVYADYYKDQMLYLRKANAECFYTGWQTIDGYTYFYDKNGKYVTGEQIIQGAKYSFDSQGRMSNHSGTLGIDVSKWNGSIDWNAVRNSGVSYVIIRCGYRGSSTGALIEDPKFASNIKGAKAAGLKVGVYFFSQAVNEVEAVEEASMALNLVSGYGLEYPVFLDVEASNGRGDAIDAATRTAVCRAFCATIQNSGYRAGVYANTTWFTTKINAGSLTDYKIWLAQYASAPTYTATRYDMWQYTSKGQVGGISGSVDMNISYLNY